MRARELQRQTLNYSVINKHDLNSLFFLALLPRPHVYQRQRTDEAQDHSLQPLNLALASNDLGASRCRGDA